MILADTGYFVALANANDRHHAAAREAHGKLREGLVTTWPVVTETCHLLTHRLSPRATQAFLEAIELGGASVFELGVPQLARVRTLMKKYEALPMDLADASLVVLAEHLGHGRILSTDRRDFHGYSFKNHKPFKNLLRID